MDNVVSLRSDAKQRALRLADKLKHYSAKYGVWIYSLSPAQARTIAHRYKGLSKQPRAPKEVMDYACQAIQYECIAEALEEIENQGA